MNLPERISPLSDTQLDRCYDTISAHTFYMIVGDALCTGEPLSVVRMGDGECAILKLPDTDELITIPGFGEDWIEPLGLTGITNREARRRVILAAESCSHFAPSVTGIYRPDYDLYQFFPARQRYVDNFFVNIWDEKMKIELFQKAGHVLFIHRNAHTADSLQLRAQGNIGVKVTYLQLKDWKQADEVVEKAARIDAPLVLFSAGPAGKYIGPEISEGGNIPKVVLDIGNTADYWTLNSLPANREAAEEFYRQWVNWQSMSSSTIWSQRFNGSPHLSGLHR